MQHATGGKVPHFFIYAKGKTANQVEPCNGSVVNRLEKIIKAPNLRFDSKTLGKMDYRMLMCDQDLEIREEDLPIIQTFAEISQNCGYRMVEDDSGKNNHYYVYQQTRQQLAEINPDIEHVVDVLIKQLFCVQNTKRKSMFWGCFGDIVLQNLRNNIDTKTVMCTGCGVRFLPITNRHVMCPTCAAEQKRRLTSLRVKKFRNKTA